ncbi:outer membrane protein assembly factor BamE domain-containing protein [Pseudomonas oligotrophica]|uniref:outer membrane protein assembly factor BamE domain-containing protein n=1 Tax=Pseudomonas oligotrophica TaxID=2912055 RepID=UPI001F2E89DB|nr:outer membrane protein assembly factor BamE [Pseudomonas oligotrophica]MCF7201272.1 outer membrane protein assembly factor BamE [Pseudomonas oligotrophica]
MSLRPFALLAVLLALAGCSKVTQENYARLEAGMSRAQVEKLLGKPEECAGALGMSSCTWGDKNRFISIQFAGDQVMMFSGKGLK